MEMEMRKFYSQLKNDKIKINWNKNPIPMKLFLSFLTVEVKKLSDFLGSCSGWTQYKGDNGLVITGGIVKVEYLDNIIYGKNLDNPYNNFVNPFYLFEIMNNEGKKFFLDYYADDISKLKDIAEKKIEQAQEQLLVAQQNKEELFEFWEIKHKCDCITPSSEDLVMG
jgi:hypothetical protein